MQCAVGHVILCKLLYNFKDYFGGIIHVDEIVPNTVLYLKHLTSPVLQLYHFYKKLTK